MFDYTGGGNGLDGNYFQCSSTPRRARRRRIRHRRSGLQARAVAQTYGTKVNGTNVHDAHSATSTATSSGSSARFGAMYNLPESPERALIRAANGSSVVVAARNLQTWSRFTGVDPGTELRRECNEVAERLQYEPAADLFHVPPQPEVLTPTEDDLMISMTNRARLSDRRMPCRDGRRRRPATT